MKNVHGWSTIALALFVLASSASSAAPRNKRYIVKSFRDSTATARADLQTLRSQEEGVFKREVMKLTEEEVSELAKSSTVLAIEEDFIMEKSLTPTDPEYSSQWHYFDTLGGINLPSAWAQTTGSSSIVVAVLDTGITAHPDFSGRVLSGADLISDLSFANDGNGRDTDPSDPGDWVNPGDPCYQGQSLPSSWHGTHVAGTIAANANNSTNVVGVNWNSKILPVRVLGKCGGYTSDIADGIRWAVGGSVTGLPVNTNPAKVINMSLGGQGPCTTDMQAAIDYARARQAVVVVAAGNSSANLDVTSFAPANCLGVIVVGATNRNGARSYYSNYGEMVDISAPGGDSMGGVLSLTNYGSTSATSNYGTKFMSGTSMAAPHVSGVISLMFSVNAGLFPDQISVLLKETARAFSGFSGCSESTCGAGILNADEAVYQASRVSPDSSVSDSEPINAGPSDEGNNVVTHQSSGGFCGSVDFGDGPGAGGGPGMMMLAFAFILATVLASKARGNSQSKARWTSPLALFPAKISRIFCALNSCMASLVSRSALAIWGVSETLGKLRSSLVIESGSLAKTSRAAPAMVLFFSAVISAISSTMGPLAVLMRMACSFMSANSRAPMRPLVASVSGQ